MWHYFYLPQIHAQLGGPAEAATAKAELLQRFPDYSLERWLSEMGGYARETELDRVLDGHRKAGLPICATEKQLAKYPDMKRLPECEAKRARS